MNGSPRYWPSQHFACHGVVDPDHPAEAWLALAGGDLSARTLLDRTRSAALDMGQAFLAACTTGVPGDAYDQAVTLATSFLTAGARTVFASLAPVPDADTSLLMYMIHHFLRREHCRPADALQRAQLWMLDPDRRLPDGTPDRLRRHHRPGQVVDPAAWAAFVHFGE